MKMRTLTEPRTDRTATQLYRRRADMAARRILSRANLSLANKMYRTTLMEEGVKFLGKAEPVRESELRTSVILIETERKKINQELKPAIKNLRNLNGEDGRVAIENLMDLAFTGSVEPKGNYFETHFMDIIGKALEVGRPGLQYSIREELKDAGFIAYGKYLNVDKFFVGFLASAILISEVVLGLMASQIVDHMKVMMGLMAGVLAIGGLAVYKTSNYTYKFFWKENMTTPNHEEVLRNSGFPVTT
ncbi:MAG: hypothetical protein Q7S22_01720 [Candidatus Micrarchaeota archaeon]|nr:hypothetical protein [Candidatus Micrarchaeota archaeon]